MRKFLTWLSLVTLIAGVFGLSQTAFAAKVKKIKVTSPAFLNGGTMAPKYAYFVSEVPDAENLSPPLKWKVKKKVAKKIKSFVISIIDIHPIANQCVHLIAVDLPADLRKVGEGTFTEGHGTLPSAETRLLNNCYGFNGYGGPGPPPGSGAHDYVITVYGLKTEKLDGLSDQPTADELKKLLKGKVVAKGKITGIFEIP